MSTGVQPSINQLFFHFLRLGITAFGGPSMVAYIHRLAVEEKGWLDAETFANGIALCQIIPGATAMQAAAYVGLKTRGVPGASVSFIGFGLPAFSLMMGFAALYTHTRNLPIVVSTFTGLQAIIVAIIANAAYLFGRSTIKNWRALAIAGLAAVLFGLAINPILVILMAAVGGLLLMPSKPGSASQSEPSSITTTIIRPLLLIVSVAIMGALMLFFLNRLLFDLALLMIRIDLFAFGGGFASVPLMFHEIVDVRKWLDSQTFMNAIVLGQVTPGPIVITATFVGYLLAGVPGGLIATIGIFLPSFVILVATTPYFDRIRTSPHFTKVITGVLCSFVGLLVTVVVRFALNVEWDLARLLLATCALVALLLKVDILWVVLIGTIVSLVLAL